MIEALILDMDGTLLYLPINYDRLKKRLQELLGTNSEFNPLFKTIATITAGDHLAYRRSLEIVDDEELRAVDGIKVSDYCLPTLEKCRSRNYPLCLVTLQGKRPAYESLRRAGITDFFQVILTREDNIDRYEQIRACVDFLKKPSSKVLVVGDRLNDILCANRTGCRSVLIRQDSYLELGDDIVSIERLSDLPLAIEHFDRMDS